MFVPGVVATSDDSGTCQEPTSDLGRHDGWSRVSFGLTGDTAHKDEKGRSAPRAASCVGHPGHTISSVVLRGEHRLSDGGCSHPADEHLVCDSHLGLEKGKKIKKSIDGKR